MNFRMLTNAVLVTTISFISTNLVLGQTSAKTPLIPALDKDYSYAYWKNGFRKPKGYKTQDILCIETGYYGLQLDMAKPQSPRIGTINDQSNFTQTLSSGTSRLDTLPMGELKLEVNHAGKTYKLVNTKAGITGSMRNTKMWEAGTVAQHFDLESLILKTDSGEELICYGELDILAWPKSLSLRADITPTAQYKEGLINGVSGNGMCIQEKQHKLNFKPGTDTPQFTVETWFKQPKSFAGKTWGWILCKGNHEGSKGNYGFYITHNVVSARINNPGGPKTSHLLRGEKIKDDVWNHLALSFDGKEAKFYINGKLAASKPINQPRAITNSPLTLGGRGDNARQIAAGIYDQVRVWNRPLSAKDIATHAAQPQVLHNGRGLFQNLTFDGKGVPKYKSPTLKDATIHLALKMGNKVWQNSKKITGDWSIKDKKSLSISCDIAPLDHKPEDIKVVVQIADKTNYNAEFHQEQQCYHLLLDRKIKRNWKKAPDGYPREYDDLRITIQNNTQQEQRVPFKLFMMGTAGITGLCPILCDAKGIPTGIPVQISKNWHMKHPMNDYAVPHAIIPVRPGNNTYILRIPYGFYGTLPSASHSQLSLVGWGGFGRWDQLAIGAWGETICFDIDMSNTTKAVTDVRALMINNKERSGEKWSWTDAGWGGDWLQIKDSNKEKLLFSEFKTAYVAHGPCLTDARYDGYYGIDRDIDLRVSLQTPRSDDIARTFITIDAKWNKAHSTEESHFHEQGDHHKHITPTVAYGNKNGLIREIKVPANAKIGTNLVEKMELTGPGPWWISFPDSDTNARDQLKNTSARALIIREYNATFSGKNFTNPNITLPVVGESEGGLKSVSLLVTPPKGLAQYQPNDTLHLETMWFTPARIAADYYGPNQALRNFLTANPKSWKTVYREVSGNDLEIKVTGGTLIKKFPIIIKADNPNDVKVDIKGGVGFVPIRFEGLNSSHGYQLSEIINGQSNPLNQALKGNDFWQTEYDTATKSYKITYNIPLDGKPQSQWQLIKK